MKVGGSVLKTVVSVLRSFLFKQKFVTFTKKKALLGLLFGIVVFCICVFPASSPKEGVRMALYFIILGLFRLDFKAESSEKKKLAIVSLIRLIWSLLCLFTVCFFSLGMIDPTISSSLGLKELALNMLFAFILYSFSFFITGNCVAAFIISALVMMGGSTINGFVFLFRGKELCAMDIFSIGTAANVASQYSYSFPPHVSLRWVWTFLAIFSQFSLPAAPKLNRASRNIRREIYILSLAVSLLSIAALLVFSRDIGVKSWEFQGSQINGFYLNYVLGIRDSFHSAPDGYSADALQSVCDEYSPVEQVNTELPNIIVIMDEAFSDLSIFENELVTNIEPAPFLSSLEENTVRGHALVSVFAGNTANSEFEFLTSHTMGFLPNPSNSVPYQQYINAPIYCLPHLAASLGYETFATHPYLADGWSRDIQYPRFGFQRITFRDEYQNPQTVRGFVSDQAMYEYILQQLTTRNGINPLFLFGVTMQNHSAYNAVGYESSIDVDGDFPLTEQYLSLIHESDKAVEYLLNELEDYPEDTVVLFFGDHMPMIEEQIFPLLNGGSLATLDEQMLKYTVPFFIWANYDIEEYTMEKTSLNYLAGHLLDAAGIELPPYYQFLRETEEIIPAINAYGYYSKAKGCMIPLAEAEGEEAEALQRYSYVQYNNMFDAKNRNELFFGQYIKTE